MNLFGLLHKRFPIPDISSLLCLVGQGPPFFQEFIKFRFVVPNTTEPITTDVMLLNIVRLSIVRMTHSPLDGYANHDVMGLHFKVQPYRFEGVVALAGEPVAEPE